MSATSSGSRAAPPPAAPPRGSSARSAIRSAGCPMSPEALAALADPRPNALALLDAQSRARSAGRPHGRAARGARRPPAGHARRGRRDPRGLRCRARRAARSLRDGGKQYIAALQQRERERTGIPSLKVGFNKVFGYYLEITNAQAARGAGRLRAAPDPGRRRAVRHARAQGVRGEGARRRRADGDARGASCSVRCAPRSAQAIGRIQRTARVLARARRAGPRWPRSRSHDRYVRPDGRRRVRSDAPASAGTR